MKLNQTSYCFILAEKKVNKTTTIHSYPFRNHRNIYHIVAHMTFLINVINLKESEEETKQKTGAPDDQILFIKQ